MGLKSSPCVHPTRPRKRSSKYGSGKSSGWNVVTLFGQFKRGYSLTMKQVMKRGSRSETFLIPEISSSKR
jgi:hypothetical protein